VEMKRKMRGRKTKEFGGKSGHRYKEGEENWAEWPTFYSKMREPRKAEAIVLLSAGESDHSCYPPRALAKLFVCIGRGNGNC